MADGARFGNYELEAFIGRGGMAEVFRARVLAGPLEGETVALKRMREDVAGDPAYVDLFNAEAEVTQQLTHPAIIRVLEAGAVGRLPYMALEFINGRDLGEIMDACQERSILLPIDFACYVAHVVAEALNYAHTARAPSGEPLCLVHCDVSPSNIFISDLGEIRLGDFGIARIGKRDPAKTIGVVGKAPYMTPEQIDQKQVSPATDVFALGAILFELLTNRPAFSGDRTIDIWDAIVDGKRPPPSKLRAEVPPELDELVLVATSPRRDAPGQRQAWKLIKDLTTRHPPRLASCEIFADRLEALYDPNIGTELAIAAVVRGLFRKPAAAKATTAPEAKG